MQDHLCESSCLKFFAELSFKKAINTKRKLIKKPSPAGKGDHGVVDEEKGFRYHFARSPHPSDGFPAEIDRYATVGHLPHRGRLGLER